MKTMIKKVFATILLLTILSSCSQDITPPISQVQNNGTGIIAGKVGFFDMEDKMWWEEDYRGIKIEIVGKNYSTFSDSVSNWVIRNIDSGVYSIRYTKVGFDTVTITNVLCNGIDSTYVSYKFSNSNIDTIKTITLIELPAKVNTSATASLMQTIVVQKDPHDSTRVISRDTVVSCTAEATTINDAALDWTRTYLPIKIADKISENANVSTNELPNDSNFKNMGWTEKGEFHLQKGATQTRTFKLFDGVNMKHLERNRTYYLHVMPRWIGLKRIVAGYGDRTYPTVDGKEIWGEIKSIPIQWK